MKQMAEFLCINNDLKYVLHHIFFIFILHGSQHASWSFDEKQLLLNTLGHLLGQAHLTVAVSRLFRPVLLDLVARCVFTLLSIENVTLAPLLVDSYQQTVVT